MSHFNKISSVKLAAKACILASIWLATGLRADADWPSQSYTNWPGTDLEWTQLTNHIEWCWQALVERGSLVGVDITREEGFPSYPEDYYCAPTYVAPYCDYVRLAHAVDLLAPHFVSQVYDEDDDFQDYFSTPLQDGTYPNDFPRWTPESLRNYAFGKSNWTTNFALNGWMTITNRDIQLEVQQALESLVWTCRKSGTGNSTNGIVRSAQGYQTWDYDTSSISTVTDVHTEWVSSTYEESHCYFYYVGTVNDYDFWWDGTYSLREPYVCREYAKPILSLGYISGERGFSAQPALNVGGLAFSAAWYLHGDFHLYDDNDAGTGWGDEVNAAHMVFVEGLGVDTATNRIGNYPFAGTMDQYPFSVVRDVSLNGWYDPDDVTYAEVECDVAHWLLKWDVPGGCNLSPPALVDYPVVETPDTDRDDLVDVPVDLDSPGCDTGMIVLTANDDNPCVFLPLTYESVYGTRVHEYLSQGAFSHLPYHYLTYPAHDPTRRDYNLFISVFDPDGYRMAASTLTRVVETGTAIEGDDHTKLAVVIRPRGNVVIFSFPWEDSKFSEVGIPLGVNSKRSYVLVDMTPDDDDDYYFQLRFASGVVHEFTPFQYEIASGYCYGRLNDVILPNDLLCDSPSTGGKVFSPDSYWMWRLYPRNRYYVSQLDGLPEYCVTNTIGNYLPIECVTNISGYNYDVDLNWNRGTLTNLTYRSVSDPEQEIAVDLTITSDGFIEEIQKSKYGETSAMLSGAAGGQPHDTVTYGSGVSIQRAATGRPGEARDVTLTTSVPDVGVSTVTVHLNAGDRVERITRAGGNESAMTSFQYRPDGSARCETNKLLSASLLQRMTLPDGASVAFEHTPAEGWLAKAEIDLGHGARQEFELDYQDNGRGSEADPSKLVENARQIERRFGADNLPIGRTLQAYSLQQDYDTQTITAAVEFCTAPNGSWGAVGNIAETSVIQQDVDYDYIWVDALSPLGTNSLFISDPYSPWINQTFNDGRKLTTTLSPYGQVLSETRKENNIVTGQLASQTDAFGRITWTDFLDGTHVEYDDYCLHGPQSVTDVDGSTRTIAYYANGLVRSIADGATGITTAYEYDPLGHPKKITRTAGAVSESESFRYDALGRLRYYKDVCGAETTIEYTNDENGIHKVMTLPTGGTLEEDFYYDGERRRIGGSAAVQKLVFERGVDEEGYYVKTINAENPSEFTIVHESFLGVSSKIKQSGTQNAISLHYDDKARFTGATDELGISSLLSYDDKNRPEFFGDDPSGTRLPDLDGNGKLFRKSRDVNANGVSGEILTYPDTGSSDAAAVAGVNVALNGLSGTYSLCGRQGSFSQSLPAANGTYTTTGARPDGSTAILTYEHWRLKSSEIKDDNNTTVESTSYEYTPLGYLDEVKSSRNGETVTTKYGRDAQGRVDAITVAGKTTHIAYEGNSRRVSRIIRPNGKAVAYEYYDNGLLESEDDDEGYDSTYTYDAMGRCTDQVVHGDDNLTLHLEWEYDQQTGQLAFKKINGVTIESYDYLDNGQVESGRDALNNEFTPAYNTLGDQTGLTCTSADNLVVDYALDRLGRCTSATSAKLVGHVYGRTLDDLLLSDQVLGGGIVQNAHFAYGHDGRGRRNAMQFSLAGQPVLGASLQHDGASRVSDIGATGGLSAHYAYSSGASLATNLVLTTPGGVEMVRSVAWDYAHLRPLDITYRVDESNVASYAYSYVTNDNRIARITAADGSWWNYAYDSRGRLNAASRHFSDGANYPGRLFAYTYDRFGNTIQAGPAPDGATPRYSFEAGGLYNVHTDRQWGSEIDVSGTVATNAKVVVNNVLADHHRNWFNAAIPVANQNGPVKQTLHAYAAIPNYGGGLDLAIARTGAVFVAQAQEAPAYNAKGEPLSDSRFRYVFNAFGWLTSVTNLVATPASCLSFAYDTGGRRIKKTVYERNGTVWAQKTVHQFYYDGWNLVGETVTDKTVVPESTTLRLYTWGLDLAGQRGGRLGQTAGGSGGLLAITEIDGSVTNVYYPVSDHIGTIHGLVDATSGETVAEYEYDPYGVLLEEAGEKADACPFRFSSKYYDSETQLLYFGYRYFNPASTKWLTVDPLQERGGLNFTAYCAGDPVNRVDPMGLYWQRNANGKWEWVSGSSCILEDMVSPGIDTAAAVVQAAPDVFDVIWNRPFRSLGEARDPIPVGSGDGFFASAWDGAANAVNMAWNHVVSPLLGGFEYHPMRDVSAGSQMAGEALFGNDISIQNRTLMLGLGAMTMAGGALPPTPGGGLKNNVVDVGENALRKSVRNIDSPGKAVVRPAAVATKATPIYTQMEFPFARGASVQTPGVTMAGERFVRVGAQPRNLKFSFDARGGVQGGTYVFPESTFNAIGRDPAALKNLGDLPGPVPQYYRIVEPPAGTPIQRGIVPGGEFGGVGGVEEAILGGF